MPTGNSGGHGTFLLGDVRLPDSMGMSSLVTAMGPGNGLT